MWWACSPRPGPRPRPPPALPWGQVLRPARPHPSLTRPQPGQELPFSQDRRRDCTPPPQLLLHLLQEPHDAQKMGTGQGVFSLQNLRGRVCGGSGHRTSEQAPPSLTRGPWECKPGKDKSPPAHSENPGHFLGGPASLGPQG